MDEQKFQKLGIKIAKCLGGNNSMRTISNKYHERVNRMDDVSKRIYLSDPLTQISCGMENFGLNHSFVYDPNNVLTDFELAYTKSANYMYNPASEAEDRFYSREERERMEADHGVKVPWTAQPPPPPPPPLPSAAPPPMPRGRESLIPREARVSTPPTRKRKLPAANDVRSEEVDDSKKAVR